MHRAVGEKPHLVAERQASRLQLPSKPVNVFKALIEDCLDTKTAHWLMTSFGDSACMLSIHPPTSCLDVQGRDGLAVSLHSAGRAAACVGPPLKVESGVEEAPDQKTVADDPDMSHL